MDVTYQNMHVPFFTITNNKLFQTNDISTARIEIDLTEKSSDSPHAALAKFKIPKKKRPSSDSDPSPKLSQLPQVQVS